MVKITLQEIWKAAKRLQQQREGNNRKQSKNKQLIKKQRTNRMYTRGGFMSMYGKTNTVQ